jgi:hypothetical protein
VATRRTGEQACTVDEELARWIARRDPDADWAGAAADAERLAPTIIGMSLAEATELARADGVDLRVVRGDGALPALTRDRRPNRVNVHVERGVIVAADAY